MGSMNFLDFINKGGLLIWPILLCSLVGVTIFFERFGVYRRVLQKMEDRKEITQAIQNIASGKYRDTETLLDKQQASLTPQERIVVESIEIQDADRETMELVLIHAVEKEVKILSRSLTTLSVIASAAPLLGLLGTVIGMIKAFMVVESMGGSVNAAVLAGGIWEAMLTTAFGLLAAIPLLFFHNHLEGKLNRIQTSLEDVAVNVMKAWSQAKSQSQVPVNHALSS